MRHRGVARRASLSAPVRPSCGVCGRRAPLPLTAWIAHPLASFRLRARREPAPGAAGPSAGARRCRRWRSSGGWSSSMPACPRPASCPARPATARSTPTARRTMPRRWLGGPHLTRQGVRAVPSLMYLERQPNFSIGPDNEENETVSLAQLAALAARRRAPIRPRPDTAQTAANLVPQGGLFWDGRADTLAGPGAGAVAEPAGNGRRQRRRGRGQAAARALCARASRSCSARAVFDTPRLAVAEALFAVGALPDRGSELPSLHQQVRLLAGRQGAAQRGRAARLPAVQRPAQGELRRLPSRPADARTDCRRSSPTINSKRSARRATPAFSANRDPGYFDLGHLRPLSHRHAAARHSIAACS